MLAQRVAEALRSWKVAAILTTTSTLSWTVAVAYLSTTPRIPRLALRILSYVDLDIVPKEHVDLVGHFAMYSVLAVLLFISVALWPLPIRKRYLVAFFSSIVATFAYGVSLEWVQSSLSYRDADVADVIANGVGAVTGAMFALLLTAFLIALLFFQRKYRILVGLRR